MGAWHAENKAVALASNGRYRRDVAIDHYLRERLQSGAQRTLMLEVGCFRLCPEADHETETKLREKHRSHH